MPRGAWYVYVQLFFDDFQFVAKCQTSDEAERIAVILRDRIKQETECACLVRVKQISDAAARRNALDDQIKTNLANGRQESSDVEAFAAKVAADIQAADLVGKSAAGDETRFDTLLRNVLALADTLDRPTRVTPALKELAGTLATNAVEIYSDMRNDAGDYPPVLLDCHNLTLLENVLTSFAEGRKVRGDELRHIIRELQANNGVVDTPQGARWHFESQPDGEVLARNRAMCQEYARLDMHDLLLLCHKWRGMATEFVEATKRSGHYHGHVVHDAQVDDVTKILGTAVAARKIEGVDRLGRCLRRPDDGHLHYALATLDELEARLRAEGALAGSSVVHETDEEGLTGTIDEGGLYPYLREQWEHNDNNLIEDYAKATPSSLLADCNRMIHCIAGFTAIFGLSPDGAAQMARGIDEEWFAGFNRANEMVCLAAVSRKIDLDPFKELASSAYSFWSGSLPKKETEDAIKKFYHPCITALFNLKRALMIEIPQTAAEGTDKGTGPNTGQETSPLAPHLVPLVKSLIDSLCRVSQCVRDRSCRAGSLLHASTPEAWIVAAEKVQSDFGALAKADVEFARKIGRETSTMAVLPVLLLPEIANSLPTCGVETPDRLWIAAVEVAKICGLPEPIVRPSACVNDGQETMQPGEPSAGMTPKRQGKMDRLNSFAKCANGAKAPKEFYEAIKGLGPLPRYWEKSVPVPRRSIHVGQSITVNPRWAEIVEAAGKGQGRITETSTGQSYCWKETEPAVEEAKAIYAHARQIAIGLRKSNRALPPLPPTESDPFLGLQTIQEWCLDADKFAPPQDPQARETKEVTNHRKGKPGRKRLKQKDPTRHNNYKTWAQAWATGKYKTYADCASDFGTNVTAKDIEDAVGYLRKHPAKRKHTAG